MNILRLVAAEKEKKNQPASPEYQKIEAKAACKDKGQYPIKLQEQDLRHKLTPEQYRVTQAKGTERPYSGKYLRNKDEGLYSCIVCDNPLFSSDEKYDSHCGWPAFHDVIAQGKVTVLKDTSHGAIRIEVCCSQCGAHLGHVFDDGPKNKRVRYCINSQALDFKRHTTV